MSENTIRKFSLKDATFINNFSERCHLSVLINSNSFAFALLDDDLNKYIQFDSFEDPEADAHGYKYLTNSFVRETEALGYHSGKFKSIRVLIETPGSTLVPAEQFAESNLSDYLTFSHHPWTNTGFQTASNKLLALKAYSIFPYPEKLKEILDKTFKNHSLFHQSSALINAILALKNSKIGRQVYINIRKYDGDILYIDEGKLRLFNTLMFNEKIDFVFHVLETLHRFQLDPEFTRVMLMGQVKEKEGIYNEFYRYIKNLYMVPRNSHFQYSQVFEKLPPHYYFSFLSVHKCV